jgi:hypothetical protein
MKTIETLQAERAAHRRFKRQISRELSEHGVMLAAVALLFIASCIVMGLSK